MLLVNPCLIKVGWAMLLISLLVFSLPMPHRMWCRQLSKYGWHPYFTARFCFPVKCVKGPLPLVASLNDIVVFNGFGLFGGSKPHVADFVAECQLDAGIVYPLGIHLVEGQGMQVSTEGHPVGQ